ncbi:MAG: mandelate racemase/muconate lactonizing enzyme family protein [Acidimicrobiia bacterium]|nr:mandelate racemase/muconate lactonizing enzyme family protein [bacterium]MYA38250.1 mandelate racemase/muconate lactonizing enzyme family protein [Acidimicrobiia bacterium]MYH05789.1 mandelate racemase/muconate lactonizing enzyme family protein [Acidimicrobiia bacterium]MYK54879.1 mandelate racemase/muconate lactonizing enzyme family protein [Acidimicrobiia bacterium]
MADKDSARAREAVSAWPEVDPFTVESVRVDVYRAPTARPVRTAFGAMGDRPAVVVEVRSSEGSVGYGEAWCNFPAPGAEYRARLVLSVLAPLIVGRRWAHPAAVFEHLSSETRIVAIQSGEPGPISQAIAGIDIALWDMAARRAGMPMWRFLRGGSGSADVAAYASGIGPDGVAGQAQAALVAGYRAFKLKVGFGEETDLRNLGALRRLLGPDTPFAVDANQAWRPEEAARWSRTLDAYDPMWLEEPIAADQPTRVWTRLAAASPIPLAGGENLSGEGDFRRAIGDGALDVIQPDVTKWGGITGVLVVAREALGAGRRFCPHHLGGGIGLVASAHLLAAVGGDGLLEVDSNPNPLREGLALPFPILSDGRLQLSEEPGLGVAPGRDAARFRTSGETFKG